MSILTKVDGAWKTAVPYTKQNGVWTPGTEGYCNVSGTKRKFYPDNEPEPEIPEKMPLNDMSWADIDKVIKAGLAPEYWKVGDTKAVVLDGSCGFNPYDFIFNNETWYCQILGFNHNAARETGGKPSVHFAIGKSALTGGVDIAFISRMYNESVADSSGTRGDFIMDDIPQGGTVGYWGYTSSYIHRWMKDRFINIIPTDLQSVLKDVTKCSSNYPLGADNNAVTDLSSDPAKLFLMSEFEIMGVRKLANEYEQNYQKQYQYYAEGNSAVRYRHSVQVGATFYWTRSKSYSQGGSWAAINGIGTTIYRPGSYSYGFVPCFAV